MAPRRWLWPCADSQVLRLPAYQKPSLHACLVHPHSPADVLVSDSDDDLDDDHHVVKRRRIEAIAHSFLAGQPIFIPSARLKGPFPVDRDLSICHEPFSSPVQPPPVLAADTFIRRKQKRPRRQPTPEPVPTPSKAPQSSPAPLDDRPAHKPVQSAKQKSLRFNLPSSAKSLSNHVAPTLSNIVAVDNAPSQSRDSPSQSRDSPNLPPSSANHSQPTPSSAAPIPDTSFLSPTPSPSKDTFHEPSPSKVGSVLRQRPASHLNKIEEAPSSLRKQSAVKKNKQLATKMYRASATFDASSPFMYRKSAPQPKKAAKPVKSRSAEHVSDRPIPAVEETNPPDSLEKRRLVLFESSMDVPTSKPPHPSPVAASITHSPALPEQEIVPAINMSFGQESLGMHFDIINHFNHDALPKLLAERRHTTTDGPLPEVRDENMSANTDLPPLDFEGGPLGADDVFSMWTESDWLHHVQSKRGFRAINAEPVSTDMHDAALPAKGQTEEDDNHDNDQTGSIDVGPHESAQELRAEATGELVDEPVDDTIVDHSEAEDPVDELPYISTQAAMQDAHRALFDASSPLQSQEGAVEVLPVETPPKQMTSPPSSPVHTITPFHQFNAEIATDTQAPLPNTQALFNGFYSPIKLSAKKPRALKRASFVPSVIHEDVGTTVASVLSLAKEDGDIAADENGQDKSELEPSNTPPSSAVNQALSPPQSLRNSSNSPDVIASQLSSIVTRESKGPVFPALHKDSIRLSDILQSVSSQRGIDVSSLFSQDTPTASSKSASKSVSRKGRKSARSSLTKRPRSSLPKPLPEKRVGMRKSLRLSLSQPNRQMEGDYDPEYETEEMIPVSQPNPTLADLGQSFGSRSSTIADGSSTIPDPSLAFNHLQKNGTPASGNALSTHANAPQSTGLLSSFQPAQRHRSSLTDLDSTIEDLQQTFLQQWDVETAMHNPAAA